MTRPDNNSSVTSSIHSVRSPLDPSSPSTSNFSSNGIAFEQQTFLGASIRGVNINAGYGDSVTTLSVDLVNDEYNVSDRTGLGLGDDVYHNGQIDRFSPPKVGSPVFFKMGQNRAPVDEAYRSIYDSIYNTNTAGNSIGRNHLCFGGILQSYVQNRGPGGNPLYSVQVVDPREILSNVEIILNNYASSTFNNKNIFNVFGFLEYNLPENIRNELKANGENIFRKILNPDGSYSFIGDDTYGSPALDFAQAIGQSIGALSFFPITGTGFSRRGPQGIPFFRLAHGLNALLGIYGRLPQPYLDAGFGSFINFRGFNYIVDVGGLPNLPPYYFVDYDQMNLLDLCLEICDVTNRELFVSLLPIIPGHPSSRSIYNWNSSNPNNFIAGIIRIDSIDRSFQPQYGAIKRYIDNLTSLGIPVENQDVGFELSNIVTDRLVVGAQEVDMYCFSNNSDRDELTVRQQLSGKGTAGDNSAQWRLNNSLKQQILPYYGLLGNKAVTIPKGYGAYQQILLDSSLLNANGVGKYYVATEIELRAALISYERWSELLLSYNEIYMEDTTGDGDFRVTVPRCVFDSDNPSFGVDGLPASPCSPPFGYPLYYKRATKLGVQGAGLSDLYARLNGVITSIAELSGAANKDEAQKVLSNIYDDLSANTVGDITQLERELLQELRALINNPANITRAVLVGLMQKFEGGLASGFRVMNRLSKKTKENSLKVYNFVRSIAEECLGKKFLVKIPKKVNTYYSNRIESDENFQYNRGPFAFRPRITNFDFGGEMSPPKNKVHPFNLFLDENTTQGSDLLGAIQVNFNPVTDLYEYNYEPEPQGGYFGFDLMQTLGGQVAGVNYGLIPQDFTKFLLSNSRIAPYVRFNHSQNLSFNGVDSNSFTQQQIVGNYFIPDLAYQLDNTGEDRVFEEPGDAPEIPAIAFVKCELDSKFYMPPLRFNQAGRNRSGPSGVVAVHGVDFNTIERVYPPEKKFVCVSGVDEAGEPISSGIWVLVPRPSRSIFSPNSASQGVAQDSFFIRDNSGYIITSELDTNHIYALITLPGRIAATKDSRFRDSIVQEVNPGMLKHLLTMDVVRIPEFSVPSLAFGSPTAVFNGDASLRLAYNIALEKTINYSLHNRLSFASPSPVYPDLVVLPLMSKERCYGPWISSSSINDGGKVEFIKDENLSPWNFSGYDLMNLAGTFRCSFTGPLLTQSERGGFVTPIVPAGISIGRFLANAGPLVTNISLDISEQGVKSTVKMDLYTVSFGKLQKQKENAIANIGRERQKLTDEKNALIRKGMAKNQTNTNYQSIYDSIKNISGGSSNYTLSNEITGPNITQMVASVEIDDDYQQLFGSENGSYSQRYDTSVSMQSLEQLNDTANLMPQSLGAYSKYYNSAGTSTEKVWRPYSKEPHNNMASTQQENLYNRQFYNES
jgi:hypothetical protein